jgi:hypothetical protein
MVARVRSCGVSRRSGDRGTESQRRRGSVRVFGGNPTSAAVRGWVAICTAATVWGYRREAARERS